ncbi:hypothetical protein [Mycobacterium uberis]|uniref:hypothetical protein n=1 Tax=Mycobacterium uberis TaxID=2162698 RepID=UPI001403A6E8|nr:hypothetical protein [Mycobacterium uberis]
MVAKFYALVERATSDGRAETVERVVAGLDDLDDADNLIDLPTPPSQSVLKGRDSQ